MQLPAKAEWKRSLTVRSPRKQMSSCATGWTLLVIREIALTSCPQGCLNTEDSSGSSVCAWLRFDFTIVFSLCSGFPLRATEGGVFCLSMGFGLPLLESHLPSRWKRDSASNPCRQRQGCFFSWQVESFFCLQVSVHLLTSSH